MRWALCLLEPAMPSTATSAAGVLGIELGKLDDFTPGARSYSLQPAEALFPRREKPKKDKSEKRRNSPRARWIPSPSWS